ncbi:MAG: ATP-binding cassette domain-containing protein [Gracilibacteraceae bacterium]|jgi:ABC-2 type transport system ATP-binding protein|nr:ATP-binding cassette domain-containing protein [Gracilibacteraceae bacterium]
MNEREIAVSVRGLTKNYGKSQVLKGVDFEIPKGSVFCLLGSNGAGKTTIIHILTTRLKPNAGEARICGYDAVKQPAKARRHFSLTGQYAAVDELLTARENLIMIGRLFHIQNPKQKADELLRRFGLTADAHKAVSAYSGGMRRRLDIAMSLTADPEIIFLDEPTTGLDPQNRLEMWQIVRELTKSGITIFLTTQYLDEAERLADTIAILNDGKIVKQGTPEGLKSLIVGSSLVLYFETAADLAKAKERLDGSSLSADNDALTLSITTDGRMKAVAEIIDRLSDLSVTQMEQKRASIEDVFLQLVTKEANQ